MSMKVVKDRTTVVVASSFTVDPLLPPLADALRLANTPHTIRKAPYGQIAEQFMSSDSVFRRTPGVGICLLRIGDLVSDCQSHLEAAARVDALAAVVDEGRRTIGMPVALVLCPDPPGRAEPTLADRLGNA